MKPTLGPSSPRSRCFAAVVSLASAQYPLDLLILAINVYGNLKPPPGIRIDDPGAASLFPHGTTS